MSIAFTPLPVEDFIRKDGLPSPDELRPRFCPTCQNLSCSPGQALGMVGHGTYSRRVLGLEDDPDVRIWVRRYLCVNCGQTTSVLPEVVYPTRQYAGVSILISLVMAILHGVRSAEVRSRLTGVEASGSWRTLARWRQQLLTPLWEWTRAQIGYRQAEPVRCRTQQAQRLRRLLGLHSLWAEMTVADVSRVVAELARARPTGHAFLGSVTRTTAGRERMMSPHGMSPG